MSEKYKRFLKYAYDTKHNLSPDYPNDLKKWYNTAEAKKELSEYNKIQDFANLHGQ